MRTGSCLRAEQRELILPLDDLDEIRPLGADPIKHGTIAAMRRGDDDRVQITATNAGEVAFGDIVKISGTTHYDGVHRVKRIDADTFEVEATWAGSELGRWEQVKPAGSGVRFDGIITGVERTAAGKLRVSAWA